MRFSPLILTTVLIVLISHVSTQVALNTTLAPLNTTVITTIDFSNKTSTSVTSTTEDADTTRDLTVDEKKQGGIQLQTITIVLCILTVAFWFITLAVSFILCMKYKSSQKKRNMPPPTNAQLSSRDYQEFSDVPDEANFVEKNSKMQNIKNKMGKAMKRNKKNRAEEGGDEFAM